jgi:hypothetical protein
MDQTEVEAQIIILIEHTIKETKNILDNEIVVFSVMPSCGWLPIIGKNLLSPSLGYFSNSVINP